MFNRTQADVDFALQKISEWMLTNDSNVLKRIYDLKGCLNVSDINRIENNIKILSEILTKYGYSPNTSYRQWKKGDIPTEDDVKRIVKSVKSLVDSFVRHEEAPDVPSTMGTYESINDIEKNLYLINILINTMEQCFKCSNTFQSGSTMFLPIWR